MTEMVHVKIKPDDDGMTGRECPQSGCEGYFKVQFGTGLSGSDLLCHCPYCGYAGSPDRFWTKEQVAYGQSVAIRQVADHLIDELRKHEFEIRPTGPFGLGISMKLVSENRPPIRYYREKGLETALTCGTCSLRYAVYGAFAYCPDCGEHNSLQILQKNVELASKELDLAEIQQDEDLKRHLIEDGLENGVSSFDGFGREILRVRAGSAADPSAATSVSFQNLTKAEVRIEALFGIRMSAVIASTSWTTLRRAFQKRHLIAHKMGIVDDAYLKQTGDRLAVLGRKVPIDGSEVREALSLVLDLGRALVAALPRPDKS